MMKSSWLVCLLACFAVSAGAKAPGGAAPKPVVSVGNVTRAEVNAARRYTGQIVSPSIVQLTARVSGELDKVGFKDGDFVKKDQMLYHLDDVRYQAALKSSEAKVAECSARLEYAQSSYDRSHSLYAKQVASKDSMENNLSTLNACKAELLAAEAALILAKDDLANTVITAPIDGKIGVTNYTVGNYITPNSGTLATIIQANPLRVRFSMSNRDFLSMFETLEKLKDLGRVRLRLADDSEYPEEGMVELIDNEANKQTDTIQIFAKFANDSKKLIPGGVVTVLLSRKNTGTLPAVMPSAVMHDSKGAYVYVVDKDNKVARRDVTLGSDTGKHQLIENGLTEGELVVTDGTHKIMPGMEIEPAIQGTK